MKILFKNTTKYNKENRNNFLNFHNNKYGKKELIKYILMIIFVIYMLLFNIIHGNWHVVIVLILIGVFVYIVNTQKNAKIKKTREKVKEFTFYFYERYIKIKYKRHFERINYFELKKIFETDENFFLYTDDKHSLILDKNGFSIGTEKEFSKFIKRKCPFKYSNKNK